MRSYWLHLILPLALTLLMTDDCRAADFFADVGTHAYFTSNVYVSRSQEPDFVLEPYLGLGLEFADIWLLGYNGRLETYILNTELLFHDHQLFVMANPAFGDDGQHEVVAEIGVDTQRNTDTYANVNLLKPYALLELTMEPKTWLRWSLSERGTYHFFYNETGNDSFDAWTRAAVTFTAQTRTTVSPRIAIGHRYYPHPGLAGNDHSDQQLEAGLHISQGIWRNAGLQWDYAYLHAFDDSLLIQRNVTAEEFNYIGESFLFTGHTALFGFKQVFEAGTSLGVTLSFRHKLFQGWTALDVLGEPRTDGTDRTDQQLEPDAWVKHTFWPKREASRGVPAVTLALSYGFLRQWSNDYWYDTHRHLTKLTCEISW